MATDKTFSVVGVSTLNGETKVRFANDVLRVKVLSKNGHTNINLIELAEPMLKLDAVNFIKGLPEFAEGDAQFAIDEFIAKNGPKPEKPAKVKAEPTEKPVKEKKAKAAKSKPEAEAVPQEDMGTVVAEAIDTAVAEAEATPEDDDENQPF